MNVFKREPVTVSLHHEVLKPWATLRRICAQPLRVLTLDFHTDTLSSLRRGIPAPERDAWQNESGVDHAITELHHDEHFDWALRSGLIDRAVILAHSPQNGPYGHPGMEVRPFCGLPELRVLLNEPDSVRDYADTLLSAGLPSDLKKEFGEYSGPWILDIDCDVFLTQKGTDFPPDGLFEFLVRQAAMITLSRESDWVRLLRFPGETITGELLAERLYQKCLRLRS